MTPFLGVDIWGTTPDFYGLAPARLDGGGLDRRLGRALRRSVGGGGAGR